MARVFARYRPTVTVIYICFSGEEQGLWGSSDHAAGLVSAGDDGKVQAMLNMDMIGYTGDLANPDVLLETGSSHQSLLTVFSAAAAAHTDLSIATSLFAWGSDHAPYIAEGMPALLTIENDWGSYAHYHKSTDTADKLVPAMALKILKMNVAAMAELMGVLFVDGFESGSADGWSATDPP
jgi:Zn-dependent M28 family amino/carboxypeptidase